MFWGKALLEAARGRHDAAAHQDDHPGDEPGRWDAEQIGGEGKTQYQYAVPEEIDERA